VPLKPDPIDVREIERRKAVLDEVFDLSTLSANGNTSAKIRKYYEDSRLGYQHVHSKDGAMHMALNPDGRFDRAGYEGQSSLVAERLGPATADVLELACGNGYNLALLARRRPQVRFVGIDLVAGQVERANEILVSLDNARAQVGDVQNIAMPDGSYDMAFVIESLCHATDLPQALGEARRVLRPGGHLIVIDAWRTDSFDTLPSVVRQAAESVERSMAVANAQQLSVWREAAADAGLRVIEDVDLTEQIVPNLERLANIADERLLAHPVRIRIARMLLPDTLLLNAVAGYLMPLTVDVGAHTYRLVTLEKS